MRHIYISIVSAILLIGCSGARAESQPTPQTASQSATNANLTPEQVIQKFAQKESEFYEAWMQYTYTQTAVIRVLSVDGAPQKEQMTIVSEVVFKDDGTREVQTIRSSGRLRSVIFTKEDKEVLDNINPFALTAKELSLYNLKFQGKEKVDELECYVFSVIPKNTKRGRLYFEGKIWVDDQDLQIVRTYGKAVPQSRDNQFPEFETIRQVIDDKYWFPVWTHADSKLRFPEQTVRVEETITYDNYKKFSSKATIQYESPNPPDPK